MQFGNELKGKRKAVKKIERDWKPESGERNSVKYAFELGKFPY